MIKRISTGLVMMGLIVMVASPVAAVTMEELRNDTKLTPARFARYFANFKYQFHDEVQDPQTFLTTRTGDCDDYATLAAEVLSARGYKTRLITVRMPSVNHVVCYVEETRCYLDFNNRTYLIRTVSSDGSLTDIARKVAKSFDSKWTSVSEFTFADQIKRLVSYRAAKGQLTGVPQMAQFTPRDIRVDF